MNTRQMYTIFISATNKLRHTTIQTTRLTSKRLAKLGIVVTLNSSYTNLAHLQVRMFAHMRASYLASL